MKQKYYYYEAGCYQCFNVNIIRADNPIENERCHVLTCSFCKKENTLFVTNRYPISEEKAKKRKKK